MSDVQQYGPNAMGHEDSSVNMRVVTISGIGLVVLVVVSFVLMWILLVNLVRHDRRVEDQPDELPGRQVQVSRLPDSPPLNPDQSVALQELQTWEQGLLDSYQWLDKQAGIARIPIERAMEIVEKDGLPKPSNPAVPTGGQTE